MAVLLFHIAAVYVFWRWGKPVTGDQPYDFVAEGPEAENKPYAGEGQLIVPRDKFNDLGLFRTKIEPWPKEERDGPEHLDVEKDFGRTQISARAGFHAVSVLAEGTGVLRPLFGWQMGLTIMCAP